MNKGLEQQFSRKQEEYRSLQEEHSSLKNKVEGVHEARRQAAEVIKGFYSFSLLDKFPNCPIDLM